MYSIPLEEYASAATATVAQCIAPSTLNQYSHCWKHWIEFCKKYSIFEYTTDENHVLAYMSFVAQNFSDGVSTAYAHQRAIANHYRLKGFPSVTDAVKVQMYMRGLKHKVLARPVQRAQPMATAILAKMRDLLNAPQVNLVTWRTVWRAHLEFVLMLRFDDVKRLKREHL